MQNKGNILRFRKHRLNKYIRLSQITLSFQHLNLFKDIGG